MKTYNIYLLRNINVENMKSRRFKTPTFSDKKNSNKR